MTSTANLCQILGGLRNVSFRTMKSHWKTTPTLRRRRNEKSEKLSLNAEGFPGLWNQRSDFKQAKQTCKILYHEHTAITGRGKKPFPAEQQVRQKRNEQFEGCEEHAYRLDASTGCRYHPSSTKHSSASSSSRWQPSSDLWSTWNLDSWNVHPGVNSEFYNRPRMK